MILQTVEEPGSLVGKVRAERVGADWSELDCGILVLLKTPEKGCKMACDEGGKRFFVGGNWKMNGAKPMIDGIVQTLSESEVPADTGICFYMVVEFDIQIFL